ncbi:hypothetical protein AADZ90_012635 [Aestuariibius sp. 2305UL40-4]|uniref:hypothetical protein n=1 Tax=Aestuariibius violaceus TaxID=3234132 RepID=UPI00345F0A22
MTLRRFAVGFFVVLLAGGVSAEPFTLSAPEEMEESGFLRHVLSRFSLKTGQAVEIVDDGADAVIGTDGVPVFREGDMVWHFAGEGAGPERLGDYLTSDIGKRTIESFPPGGDALYSADVTVEEVVVTAPVEGDAVAGADLSLELCGRCHVVGEVNRMKSIGSTPSFAALRALSDWQARFETFYVLAPHGAFTQVEDVTPPFDPERPSPIAPVELTLEELEAITAFVAGIAAADLGKPVQSR